MSKSKTKSKRESRSRNIDELDDVDALFFLSEEEVASPGVSKSTSKRAVARRAEPAKVVALVSRKGGTGKTSIAMNLAALLTTSRRRVVVLDLDRGADAAKWHDRGERLPFTVARVEAKDREPWLTRSLAAVRGEADLVILDTPPASVAVMRQAVQAAALVLIPVGPSALDLTAAVDVVNESLEVQGGLPADSARLALVPSRLIPGTRLAKDLPRRLKKLSLPVAPGIGQRVEVAAAGSEGRTVRPKSQAGVEFARLARYVVRNLRPK